MMAPTDPITRYRLTDHARLEMARRLIAEKDVAMVLAKPEQVMQVRKGRVVYQSRLNLDEPPRLYLVRVIVDVDRQPPEVVTVYRTSKIEKYWRNS
jgi:hypothetical protein